MTDLRQAAACGGRTLTPFGVIAIVLGILAMLAPGIAGLSIAMLLGLFVTATGILRMIWALQGGEPRQRTADLALGSLPLICGLALLANPVLGAGVLTLVLVSYFVADGILEIAAGFTSPGGIWRFLGGAISMLLGVMLWSQYPLSGAWAMGTFLGIKLFFVGLVMVNRGSPVRALATA